MCGIFAVIGNHKNSAEMVLRGLKLLEYRGYDSWGVAVVPLESQKIVVKKQVGKIGNASVADMPLGTLALGHTRWATHGGVTVENSHPHLDCSGKFAVVQNGIFENYLEVKEQLSKCGHIFKSQTDAEVIVHLLEEKSQNLPFVDAVRETFLSMKGLNAIIAINTADRMLVAIRNGSPLVVGYGEKENYLASDPAALLEFTKTVHFLEDNEMAVVTEHNVEITNILTKQKIVATKRVLDWDLEQTDKGEYPYFMLKEIHEQPKIIASIASNASQSYTKIAHILKNAPEVCFVGCGSSSYESLAGKYLFSKIAKLSSHWAVGSEFSYDLEVLLDKSVIVALSQSGETMDLLEPLKQAKKKGISIIALVNVLGSSLYRLANEVILIGAGPEKAVATTKALTGKLAHLILLAYSLVGKIEEGQKILFDATRGMKKVLAEKPLTQIQSLAKKYKDHQHIYVLGRGISYPVSLETALKIKEISYIHAEGLAGGELKHGTLALIEKGTPCLAFLPNDETYEANLAGAMEMKARGAHIIGISFQPHEIFDEYFEIETVGIATILPNLVFSQLFAYFLAIEKGLNPDMPRNLAKSVTVK